MQSKIEQQVMGSVGAIYTARQLTSKIALEFYALVVGALVLWRLVWVHKVLTNLGLEEHGGIGAVWNYITVALEHAHLGVLLALVVCAVAAALLIKDALRSLATPRLLMR